MARGSKKGHPFLIIIVVLLAIAVFGRNSDNSKNTRREEQSKTTVQTTATPKATSKPTAKSTTSPTNKPTSQPTVTPKPAEDWLKEYEKKGIDVIKVPADVLYEYGSTYVGKTIVTAITVEAKSSDMLKANTDNNDSFSYSIVAEFANPSELNSIKENGIAIVIGTVGEMNGIDLLGSGKTIDLNNCHIVTNGITASEIDAARNEQVSASKAEIAAAEETQAEAKASEIQTYMDNCESVSYSDVERNPNQYKGKQIKVTGRVEQVSEGWFNSVTMRVDQGSGKMWYIT